MADPPRTVLNWEVTRADVHDALAWRLWHGEGSRWVRIGCIVGLVFSVVLFVTAFATGRYLSLAPAIFLLLVPVLIMLVPRLAAGRVIKQNPSVARPNELRVGPDGLEGASEQASWSQFSMLRETRRCLLLRYADRRVDLIIPKHAFDDDDEVRAFRRYVEDRMGAARAG